MRLPVPQLISSRVSSHPLVVILSASDGDGRLSESREDSLLRTNKAVQIPLSMQEEEEEEVEATEMVNKGRASSYCSPFFTSLVPESANRLR